MVKTRRSNGRGIFRRVYSPIHHGLYAARDVVNAGLNTVGKVLDAGVSGVDRAGSSVAGHANAALSNVFRGISGLGGKMKGGKSRSRKNRKTRKTRKSRR